MPIRTLVQMDAPDHPVYRRITSDWFKPRTVGRLGDRIAELAKRYVDRMADLGGECDFVTDVAMHYPLYVILSILGLPEDDFPRMLTLTQEMFGTNDPELARDRSPQAMQDDAAGVLRVLPGASPPIGAPTRPTISRRSSPTPRSTANPSARSRRSATT